MARYFANEQQRIAALTADVESIAAKMCELEEQHNVDGGFLEFEPLNRANVVARLKEIAGDKELLDEGEVLKTWLRLNSDHAETRKKLNTAETELDALAHARYATLDESEIKSLVVDDKWLATMRSAVHGELNRVSEQLAKRVKELAERYETPAPEMTSDAMALELKVSGHLERMGFSWS